MTRARRLALTACLLGIAATQHHDSIIFRREFTQFTGPGALIAQSRELFGIHGEYNGSDHAWRGLPGGRSLQFGSVQHEKDRRKWAGRPHDLKCYDELPQIPEALYRYLNTWLRTTQHGQRCRIVGTGNPPLTEEERWVLRYWGPWLDKHNPHPASPGALRWYIVDDSGKDLEVAGPEWGSARPSPILVHGRLVAPRSRTFIPSQVEDNPYYMRTGYAEKGFRLSAVGVDTSRGGTDEFVIAKRRRQWFDELVIHAAKEAKDGQTGAALVYRAVGGSDSLDVPIQIDLGGQSGPSVYDHCGHLNMFVVGLDGSRKSEATDKTKTLGFVNKRAEWHWRMRELLDPANKHDVALPPDPQLRSDLCAPRWELRLSRIKIEDKDEIKKRIGRSPDRGEAVIYAAVDEAPMQAGPTGVGDSPSYWGAP